MGCHEWNFLYGVRLVRFSGVHPMNSRMMCVGICLFLIACSSSTYHFRITGVEGEFCVPKTGYVAPGVWFAPEDAPGTPEGFSFGGCHRLKHKGNRAACVLPDDFIATDVYSLQARRNQFWSELKRSADFDLLVNTPGTKYAIDSETGYLVVSNQSSKSTWQRRGWSIWRRSPEPQGNDQPVLRDDDELVAVCSRIEDYPGTGGLGTAGDFGCDRYVRGDRYALDYSFISRIRVPTEKQMMALESALFGQVDAWQCSE